MTIITKVKNKIVRILRSPRQRRVVVVWIMNGLILFPKRSFKLFIYILRLITLKILPARMRVVTSTFLLLIYNKNARVRRFLHPQLTLKGFFEELKKRNIEYVMLRWFEDLPCVSKGEDIDILIKDADLERIKDLFGIDMRKQPFDIYSVTGLPGSNYNNVPYYPPHLAQQILQSRIWLKDIYAVPSVEHYFLSFAYHSVFHKGKESGLSNCNQADTFKADHNYSQYLKRLAEDAGYKNISYDFNDLFELLKTEGWMPQLDTLRILSLRNQWLQALIPEPLTDQGEGEMLLFVIRDWAMANDKMEIIVERLKQAKLDVLSVRIFSQEQKDRARAMLRGGKWDKGPFPVSGGLPGAFIFCYDYHPEPPTKRVLKKYPFIKNRNVHLKHKIRQYGNADKLVFFHANFIHSADDPLEAWTYLKQVIPEDVDQLRHEIQNRRRAYKTEFPVVHLYKTNRTRAKVEKIDYFGTPAVKKTFKQGRELFADREAFVYKKFSPILPAIPPLLERGSNYIIIPWYENILKGTSRAQKKKLIKPHAKVVLHTMKVFYEQGYALIGFYPGNILITPENEIKIVDFEFLYKYEVKPKNFSLSYDIVGVPKGFQVDLPMGIRHIYNDTWKPIFGPLREFVSKDDIHV